MEGIELPLNEVIEYFQKAYPKEFEITILTLQNQKLIKLLEDKKESSDE